MEHFIEDLLKRYPHGNLHLESEINSLKRKLDDLSDSDNEDLIRTTIQAENKWNKLKSFKKENRIKKHGYPHGNLHLNDEINSSKRKLHDLSDSDNEDLIRTTIQTDNKLNELKSIKKKTQIKKQKQIEKISNKKFSCEKCDKSFDQKKTLTRHIHAHTMKYSCEICNKIFDRKDTLKRHELIHQRKLQIPDNTRQHNHCKICGKTFDRKDQLNKHAYYHRRKLKTTDKTWKCKHCDCLSKSYEDLVNHISKDHPLQNNQSEDHTVQPFSSKLSNTIIPNIEDVHKSSDQSSSLKVQENGEYQIENESALNNAVQNKVIFPNNGERHDLLTFFTMIRSHIETFLKNRSQRNSIKYYISTQVEMYRHDVEGDSVSRPHFRGGTYILLNSETFIEHELNESFQKMFQSFEAYIRESSGWLFQKVLHLKIHTINYKPLGGSSFINLPLSLKQSHCILNIHNNDNKCFLWSILASLHPNEFNSEKVDHYIPYEHTLNLKNVDFPVSISQIDKFENQNKSLSVNVFTYEDKEIIPLKITKHVSRQHHINLLLLKSENVSHYCLIKNLNRFLSRTKKHKAETHFCSYCLQGFSSKKHLNDHTPYCSVHGPQKVSLPNAENALLKFSDFEKTQEAPFVIYCDFETLNTPLLLCESNPSESSSTKTKHLIPCGFAYKVVSIESEYTKKTCIYRGPNVAEKFLNCLLKENIDIQEKLKIIQPIDMDDSDELFFQIATECCICERMFLPSDIKVRHHNHVLMQDNYIGAAHQKCNILTSQKKFIPVFFHNLKHFDGHIICQAIGMFKESDIKCIPQNMENYISFSLGSLRFLDSFAFLPSSLESLVQNLLQDGKSQFRHMQSEFREEHIDMLLRKGVYPYDYIDNLSKFEDSQLPQKEHFFSSIKKESISNSDYEYACHVFDITGCENMGDYHDLYLKTDCILLCDIFEQFRSLCLKQYGLDPAHYYTSPGLSWSAMLKKTKVCLELMTDIDQVLFIERGIRGGISQISNRYKKANNPYVENYDSSQKTSFLQYLDANALYSHSMSQYLPTGLFTWLDQSEIDQFDVGKIKIDSSVGYILEVDLEYPNHLHTQHNSYPLAPEKKLIEVDSLSHYAKRIYKKLHNIADHENMPPLTKVEKLLTTLDSKRNYILHYRNLQLYLELGLELKKIHRVLKFHQEPFLESYISLNTDLRKKSKSTFEKKNFKLMNNSVFGKTMENLRLHKNVQLCQREDRLRKLSAKSTYKGHKIFSQDLVAIELSRAKVLLNKPCYVGMAILDLSKHHMYEFYYKFLHKMYGESLELQMTDTDSFLFFCETNDIFKDMEKHSDLFDFSDFDSNHALHSNINKKVVGKFKSETAEKCISEFVGLRSKLYSFLCDNKEEKRAKGVSKNAVAKDIHFHHYKSVLFDENVVRAKMVSIRSHSHELYCEQLNKIALTCFDDKRYLLENGVKSLAYGHHKITE